MSKIKVCIITNSKNYKGGIAAVVGGYSGSKLEKDCVVHYVESCTDSKKYLVKIGKMFLGYIQFLLQLLFFRPDIVHINSSFGFSFYRKLFYIYVGKAFGAKVVNHIHGAEFEKFFETASEKKKKQIKRAYGHCDCLIALSDEWKNNLKKIVSEEKIQVVENYSIMHRTEAKEKYRKNILFLGEVGKRKGCCDIPDVVAKVKAVHHDCRFILAGNLLEEDYALIKEKVRNYGIEDNISFPGWVRGNEKCKLLTEADIFFLPSYNEGMPMAILDAMGYALPIISTTVGGITKIVKNGINGYVGAPGDVDTFANRICELLSNPSECRAFGDASLRIIKTGYSLEIHIAKLEQVYESVMGQ